MKTVKKLWVLWVKIAKPIGNFQARVFFTLFYFILLFLVGIPFRLFSDALRMHASSFRRKSAFTPWEHERETLQEARKPF